MNFKLIDKILFLVLQCVKPIVQPAVLASLSKSPTQQLSRHFFSVLKPIETSSATPCGYQPVSSKLGLTVNKKLLELGSSTIGGRCQQQTRSVTKFSLKKGKRKSVKSALKRFFRLEWGGWIRTKTGRHKKMWKKRSCRKRRLRQHVLVNSTQAWMLDKMVTTFWRKPKYYVDDPYRPYHSRENYFATRKKPIKY